MKLVRTDGVAWKLPTVRRASRHKSQLARVVLRGSQQNGLSKAHPQRCGPVGVAVVRRLNVEYLHSLHRQICARRSRAAITRDQHVDEGARVKRLAERCRTRNRDLYGSLTR
jgi:hypothetical protein